MIFSKRLFVVFLLLFSMVLHSQSNEFVIEGSIAGVRNNTLIYLKRNNENGASDTIATANIINGKFTLKGTISIIPQFHYLFIKEKEYPALLFLDNSFVKLTINMQAWPTIKVTGSKSHDEYVAYERIILPFDKRQKQIYYDVQEAGKRRDSVRLRLVRNEYEIVNRQIDSVKANYLSLHPGSLYAPVIIMDDFKMGMKQKEIAYNKLSVAVKESFYGLKLNAIFGTAIGKKLPDIPGNMTLNKIYQDGKLTMIDFWASWCVPCREKFPLLKKLYDKFHSKGFNIFGYSVDESEEEWKKAIAQDNLPWYNIRETDINFAKKIYNVSSYPTLFLIDSSGKIISNGYMTDEILEKIVTEYFAQSPIREQEK